MNESKPTPQPHENTNGGNAQREHRPYWKRAHRDWRIWVFVALMLAAMTIYVLTGDLRWPIHGGPQLPPPVITG